MPCSLQHGQRVIEPPRQLLTEAGFEVVDVPERHFCCGSAGTYNLLQPDIASALGRRKAAHVGSVDPDIVAAGNLGCMVQIGRFTCFAGCCTPSSCWIGRPAGRCRPPCVGRALREPQPEPRRSSDIHRRRRQPTPASGDAFQGTVMSANLEAFFADAAKALGADGVNRSEETIRRYGENTMAGRRQASGRRGLSVIDGACAGDRARSPTSTACRFIRSAPATISGSARARRAREGQVVVDLGHRMNRILEIDEKLAFAVVEPGVSYQAIYDELVRRGNKLMLDVTSGPPQGGMIGNALDKGAGYTPYFDHFGFSCGLEVVLGNGEILRTGDGALTSRQLINWHTSKYSFGPILDGLFAQSNYGIVTRMGVWLLPRPPAIRSFHFAFPDDDDLEQIIELCRPMKLSNFVPSLFRVAERSLFVRLGRREPGIRKARRASARSQTKAAARCAEHFGLGAWNVSGAFYGPSMAALDPMIQRVRDHFGQSKKGALYRARGCRRHSAAAGGDQRVLRHPELGRTRPAEMAAGRRQSLVPAGHADGRQDRQRIPAICRKIYEDHGLDYTVMNVCGPRFARGLHVITFNREDADERARADACYRKMSEAVGQRGVFVGRAPIDYHDFHMAQAMPAYRDACTPDQDGARSAWHHRARPLRHRCMRLMLITRIGLPSRKARMSSTVSP